MTVALLVQDSAGAERRLVPVAPEQLFVSEWLPGARRLGLEWIDRMETGFNVTAENRDPVVSELRVLRAWMVECNPASLQIGRLDQLVNELIALRFDSGATAFLG